MSPKWNIFTKCSAQLFKLYKKTQVIIAYTGNIPKTNNMN